MLPSKWLRELVLTATIILPTLAQAQAIEPFTLLEVIHVQGECWENNSNVHGKYAGQIVRWKSNTSSDIAIYGSVNLNDINDKIMQKAINPTRYFPPDIVEFPSVKEDLTKPVVRLNGISFNGENEQGLDSTCQLDITKRDMTLDEPK